MPRIARPSALPPATDRLVIVDASAGTGKTYFLEHRVVDLIISAGAELAQVLVVTFTDKAVAELRIRIRDLLDRLARATTDTAAADEPGWDLDATAQARLRAAVTAFDRAPIFTIHGFCHRVLVEDAFAARRLFDQTQVADEVAFDAAFAAVLRERFACVEPDRSLLAAYLADDKHTVESLRDLLLACVRTAAEPRRAFDAEAIARAIGPVAAAFGDADAIARVDAAIKWDNKIRRFKDGWLDVVAAAFADLTEATPAARLLAAVDASRDKLAHIRGQLVAPAHAGLASCVDDALAQMPLAEALASELLPHVVARVDADKATRGLFDYDDMLELVRRTLTGPRGDEVAARLRARTPWVLIDEFQDTDPRQWQIFRTVWTHADARGLAIVGDPKQAIYAFRGADVTTYLDARADLRRSGACEVALDVNRRSTPQLVAAVNHILVGPIEAPALMPLMQGAIRYDRAVTASGDVTCDDARAVTVLAVRGGGASAEAQKLALASAIGAAIEQLRAAPPAWRGRGGAVPFSLAQVMVLTERNAESAEIAAALRRRGLACALVESEQLFDTREAAELADLLAAIAAPRDRGLRLRALRTRFFDVPWRELAGAVDAPDHHPAIARLHDWANLAARRAYEPLFRRIVEDSRFAERALVVGGGERAVTNTWHLIELLLLEVARARCDAGELAAQLRRTARPGADGRDRVDDLDVQRADTDVDAIRVLTVHKAKGLEAPYVLFYGGTSRPPNVRAHALRDAAGRRLVVSPDVTLRDALSQQRAGEAERLAYVALTRAQVRLFLPYYSDLKDNAMYHCVQRCLAPIALGRATAPGIDVVPIDVGGDEAAPASADALAAFEAPPPPDVAELAPITGPRAGLLALSYTRLAHDLDRARLRIGEAAALATTEHARDDDDLAGDGIGVERDAVDPDVLRPGIASGVFLHDVLEHVDIATARDAADAHAWASRHDVRDLLRGAAQRSAIDPRQLGHAARIVHRTLTAPLPLDDGGELPPLVAASALAREVEFAFPLAATSGMDRSGRAGSASGPLGIVKGFIDVLACWGDELWVLDYKSDAIAGDVKAARQRVGEHYLVQARLYALAAQRLAATKASTRRLAGVAFVFVRDHVTVPVRTSADQLDAWARWLGGVAS